jgi:hypothetical protein
MATLLRVIPSTAKNFAIEEQRHVIMNGIFAGLSIDDEEI